MKQTYTFEQMLEFMLGDLTDHEVDYHSQSRQTNIRCLYLKGQFHALGYHSSQEKVISAIDGGDAVTASRQEIPVRFAGKKEDALNNPGNDHDEKECHHSGSHRPL